MRCYDYPFQMTLKSPQKFSLAGNTIPGAVGAGKYVEARIVPAPWHIFRLERSRGRILKQSILWKFYIVVKSIEPG